MRKLFSSIALSLALTTGANAAEYTVQVGAYRTITQQTIERAQRHGQTFQREGSDNLKRLTVGSFSSRANAKNMRDKLQAAGYTGAFVTRLEDSSSSYSQQDSFSTGSNSSEYTNSGVSHQSSSSYNQPRSSYKRGSSYTIDDLSSDERQQATYLDDQLRILSNGRFYTVDQYRQQKRQQNRY